MDQTRSQQQRLYPQHNEDVTLPHLKSGDVGHGEKPHIMRGSAVAEGLDLGSHTPHLSMLPSSLRGTSIGRQRQHLQEGYRLSAQPRPVPPAVLSAMPQYHSPGVGMQRSASSWDAGLKDILMSMNGHPGNSGTKPVPLREHQPPHSIAGAATYLNSFYATADAPVYPTVAWVSSNGLPGTAVKAKPPKHVAQPYMQSGSLGGGGGSKSSPSRKPKQQHEQDGVIWERSQTSSSNSRHASPLHASQLVRAYSSLQQQQQLEQQAELREQQQMQHKTFPQPKTVRSLYSMHAMDTNPALPSSTSTYALERFHSPLARSGHDNAAAAAAASRPSQAGSSNSAGNPSSGPGGHANCHPTLPNGASPSSSTTTSTTTVTASAPTTNPTPTGANRAVLTTSVFALTHPKPLSVVYSPVLKSRPSQGRGISSLSSTTVGVSQPHKNSYLGCLPAAPHWNPSSIGGLGGVLNSPTGKAPLPTHNALARMQLSNNLMDDRSALHGSPRRTAALLSPDPVDVKHEAFRALSLELEGLLGNIKSELASGSSIQQRHIASEIPKTRFLNVQPPSHPLPQLHPQHLLESILAPGTPPHISPILVCCTATNKTMVPPHETIASRSPMHDRRAAAAVPATSGCSATTAAAAACTGPASTLATHVSSSRTPAHAHPLGSHAPAGEHRHREKPGGEQHGERSASSAAAHHHHHHHHPCSHTVSPQMASGATAAGAEAGTDGEGGPSLDPSRTSPQHSHSHTATQFRDHHPTTASESQSKLAVPGKASKEKDKDGGGEDSTATSTTAATTAQEPPQEQEDCFSKHAAADSTGGASAATPSVSVSVSVPLTSSSARGTAAVAVVVGGGTSQHTRAPSSGIPASPSSRTSARLFFRLPSSSAANASPRPPPRVSARPAAARASASGSARSQASARARALALADVARLSTAPDGSTPTPRQQSLLQGQQSASSRSRDASPTTSRPVQRASQSASQVPAATSSILSTSAASLGRPVAQPLDWILHGGSKAPREVSLHDASFATKDSLPQTSAAATAVELRRQQSVKAMQDMLSAGDGGKVAGGGGATAQSFVGTAVHVPASEGDGSEDLDLEGIEHDQDPSVVPTSGPHVNLNPTPAATRGSAASSQGVHATAAEPLPGSDTDHGAPSADGNEQDEGGFEGGPEDGSSQAGGAAASMYSDELDPDPETDDEDGDGDGDRYGGAREAARGALVSVSAEGAGPLQPLFARAGHTRGAPHVNDVIEGDGVRLLGQKYEVLHIVGEGAYGLVMKCRIRGHASVGTDEERFVAIKEFKIEDDDPDADDVKRTSRREVALLRDLQHPNVVEFVDEFMVRDRLFITMEFVPCNLLELLEAQPGGMDREAVRLIMFQLCTTITFIHSKNVVYRDIKPENLLVDERGRIKLCDFGFARYIPGADEPLTDYVATRWYRAPELLLGPPFKQDDVNVQYMYNHGIDIWAIGCLMGELIDGEPLFPGDSDLDQLYRIQQVLGPVIGPHQAMFDSNPHNTGIVFNIKKHQTLADRYADRMNEEEVDFMAGLLHMDPAQRLTGQQCLQHPYLAQLFKATFGPSSPSHTSQDALSVYGSGSRPVGRRQRETRPSGPAGNDGRGGGGGGWFQRQRPRWAPQ
ncbi:MAG: hypothetical protein WDW38_001683 [Sanguina aurantia]